ncbi:hypothetical protein BVtw_09500 [Bartonella vinsonii subsp. berkhoffii str. Tweed]|uniref:Tail assembly chaperone E/41/14-like protein n=1 Tax=Bartonella vinsonii subsp. berkhoffii str. Tweed TaxID=1094502 RepID=N6VNB8_BARVB|nr:hypothetical protein [Bartonella vinsonii]ENN94676.1 hypothetical protein BVtw_09500 [Bartonella vinsonii subsp. berkhoffii str. Tweed]
MTSLQTSIDVELQVPLLYQDSDGKQATRHKLTFYRPTFKHAKQLAVLIGPQLTELLVPEFAEQKTLPNDVLLAKLSQVLFTSEATECITALLADMSHESVELIDRVDVVDLVAIFKAFFAFFTQRQSSLPDNLEQN